MIHLSTLPGSVRATVAPLMANVVGLICSALEALRISEPAIHVADRPEPTRTSPLPPPPPAYSTVLLIFGILVVLPVVLATLTIERRMPRNCSAASVLARFMRETTGCIKVVFSSIWSATALGSMVWHQSHLPSNETVAVTVDAYHIVLLAILFILATLNIEEVPENFQPARPNIVSSAHSVLSVPAHYTEPNDPTREAVETGTFPSDATDDSSQPEELAVAAEEPPYNMADGLEAGSTDVDKIMTTVDLNPDEQSVPTAVEGLSDNTSGDLAAWKFCLDTVTATAVPSQLASHRSSIPVDGAELSDNTCEDRDAGPSNLVEVAAIIESSHPDEVTAPAVAEELSKFTSEDVDIDLNMQYAIFEKGRHEESSAPADHGELNMVPQPAEEQRSCVGALPLELTMDIYRTAADVDRGTCRALCSVSRAMRKLALPLTHLPVLREGEQLQHLISAVGPLQPPPDLVGHQVACGSLPSSCAMRRTTHFVGSECPLNAMTEWPSQAAVHVHQVRLPYLLDAFGPNEVCSVTSRSRTWSSLFRVISSLPSLGELLLGGLPLRSLTLSMPRSQECYSPIIVGCTVDRGIHTIVISLLPEGEPLNANGLYTVLKACRAWMEPSFGISPGDTNSPVGGDVRLVCLGCIALPGHQYMAVAALPGQRCLLGLLLPRPHPLSSVARTWQLHPCSPKQRRFIYTVERHLIPAQLLRRMERVSATLYAKPRNIPRHMNAYLPAPMDAIARAPRVASRVELLADLEISPLIAESLAKTLTRDVYISSYNLRMAFRAELPADLEMFPSIAKLLAKLSEAEVEAASKKLDNVKARRPVEMGPEACRPAAAGDLRLRRRSSEASLKLSHVRQADAAREDFLNNVAEIILPFLRYGQAFPISTAPTPVNPEKWKLSRKSHIAIAFLNQYYLQRLFKIFSGQGLALTLMRKMYCDNLRTWVDKVQQLAAEDPVFAAALARPQDANHGNLPTLDLDPFLPARMQVGRNTRLRKVLRGYFSMLEARTAKEAAGLVAFKGNNSGRDIGHVVIPEALFPVYTSIFRERLAMVITGNYADVALDGSLVARSDIAASSSVTTALPDSRFSNAEATYGSAQCTQRSLQRAGIQRHPEGGVPPRLRTFGQSTEERVITGGTPVTLMSSQSTNLQATSGLAMLGARHLLLMTTAPDQDGTQQAQPILHSSLPQRDYSPSRMQGQDWSAQTSSPSTSQPLPQPSLALPPPPLSQYIGWTSAPMHQGRPSPYAHPHDRPVSEMAVHPIHSSTAQHHLQPGSSPANPSRPQVHSPPDVLMRHMPSPTAQNQPHPGPFNPNHAQPVHGFGTHYSHPQPAQFTADYYPAVPMQPYPAEGLPLVHPHAAQPAYPRHTPAWPMVHHQDQAMRVPPQQMHHPTPQPMIHVPPQHYPLPPPLHGHTQPYGAPQPRMPEMQPPYGFAGHSNQHQPRFYPH